MRRATSTASPSVLAGYRGRVRDPQAVEHLREPLAVLGQVDSLRLRAEDGHACFLERPRKLERRLAAERHEHACGLLGSHDVHDVFEREWLEVEAVGGVVVSGDRLRVAVHHDRLEAHLRERVGGVHAAVVELDPLADPVGPAPRIMIFSRSEGATSSSSSYVL